MYALREDFMPVFQASFLAEIARVKIALGKLREGEAVLKQAFAAFDRGGLTCNTNSLFVADAHLQLALGNPEHALERMEALIQRLHHSGSRNCLAEGYWLQGKAWLALAKVEQAREACLKAKAAAEENSERTILWQILASLAELEKTYGNVTEADRMTGRALEVISYIADHAGTDEFRSLSHRRSN